MPNPTVEKLREGVRIPIERMAALNKWKMVGEVLIPGVLNVGEIVPFLEKINY